MLSSVSLGPSREFDEVATFIRAAKAKEAGLPVYVLGHSAGGVVSCVYTLDLVEGQQLGLARRLGPPPR
jgi:alpha-beta hydrolase superfamily lysophospholipase